MTSIVDDRGYNQGFQLSRSTEYRMHRRADFIISQMDLSRPREILEIGCGTGEISYWIAEKTDASVIGTDICVPFIESAAKRFVLPNLRYEVLDFNSPEQINSRKFDYIIGNGILHHLYFGLDSALVTIRSLLKNGGKMVFLEPNIYNPYCAVIFRYARTWANLEPDEMAFSGSFIKKKLQMAGYSDITIEYRDFVIPGIPYSLVRPSVVVGAVLEKLPVVNRLSQSIYITATQ